MRELTPDVAAVDRPLFEVVAGFLTGDERAPLARGVDMEIDAHLVGV